MSKIKILILGSTGIFGNGLFTDLSKYKDFDVHGTAKGEDAKKYFEIKSLEKIVNYVDVENTDSLARIFNQLKPDVVINCIGLVKHLINENNIQKAISLNALLPHRLAELCQLSGSRLIHFSTDCVFSGNKGFYTEKDLSDADDIYGKTKALGEIHSDQALTIRTSIIGHSFENDLQLTDWFLAQEGKIKGFRKVIYSGVPTVEMARIIAEYVIPNKKLKGLYQVSAEPISKFDLLKLIAKVYGKKVEIKEDIETVNDRSLDSSRFRKATGYLPPTWPILIKKMHQYYLKNKNFIQF